MTDTRAFSPPQSGALADIAIAPELTGAERHQHGRFQIENAYAVIDGERFPLVDISIGGFQARNPGDPFRLGDMVDGSISHGARRSRIEFEFAARIVRSDLSHGLFAGGFEPLAGDQIDRLLNILSGIEAAWRAERARLERGRQRRRTARRTVFTLIVLSILGAASYVGWAVLQAA